MDVHGWQQRRAHPEGPEEPVTAGTARSVELIPVTGDAGLIAVSVTAGDPVAGSVPFELTLRNVGHDTVAITNPYEGAAYHLISPSGAPVQVKAPPSQAKVHAVLDPAGKLAYLNLVGVVVDGTTVATEEFIRSASVDLIGGGEIVLSLAVTTSLDPTDRATLDHVPAGDYQLIVTLRVIVNAGGVHQPMLLRTAHDLPVAAT